MVLLLLMVTVCLSSFFEPLHVLCEINGYMVPAMVDTGAEITVMSSSCAKRCCLSRAIDPRHSGRVVGVGHSEIVGGIDGLGMRIGPLNFQNKVSILRNSRCDLLIGMDILERFKCDISIRDRTLKFNVKGNEVRIPIINRAFNGKAYDRNPSLEQKVPSSEKKIENQKEIDDFSDDYFEDDNEQIDNQNISLEGV
jgi:DNA damage-inducible protein 1